jgi:hypothetical protein
LSPQLQPFGKSDDDLGELTFEIEHFSALFVWHGQSTGRSQTVRGLPVRRVFFVFLLAFRFDPFWF